MIDFHSHILPGMDDGSKDENESLAMLKMLAEQKVDTVCATPHFYPEDENVKSFLSRREEAYAKISGKLDGTLPEIRLGAEISYYDGISYLEDFGKLTLQDTRILLVEMPMAGWSKFQRRELLNLAGSTGCTVVLAHIDRYLDLQERGTFEELKENGILFQVNASFFKGFFNRKKAISFLRRGMIHFVGSDAHNLKDRKPEIGAAFDFIAKKEGDEALEWLNSMERGFLRMLSNK